MDTSKQILVSNMAGNEMAKLDSVDITKTTGWDLKQMIARTTGFASVGMQLRFADDEIRNGSTVEASLKSDHMNDACITVTCVLAPARPWGKKMGRERGHDYFGSKTGMTLEPMLSKAYNSSATRISQVACISKAPDAEWTEKAKDLIKESFAPGLAPLIAMAVDAAYQKQESSGETDTTKGPILYEDESGAYADLSSCELWTRTVQIKHLAHAMKSPLVCALLWRLLPAWEGNADYESGPVLEVLFLATGPDFRELGVAKQLVNELESTAKTMGCIAVAVAAVPCQGLSLWRGCGYEVAVPLLETSKGGSEALDTNPGLGEPLTALGDFLLTNMLLFTDTPLVAKMLAETTKKRDVGEEDPQ